MLKGERDDNSKGVGNFGSVFGFGVRVLLGGVGAVLQRFWWG
jgi:hypothetical protein